MNEELRVITVLDFEKGKVFQHALSDGSINGWNPNDESCEDYLIEQGYSLGNRNFICPQLRNIAKF